MTREELLRHARALYECSQTPENVKSALEEKFPELHESEDERIRKEIIEFISWAESRGSVRGDWHQKKCPGNWIAYLEKQKEQKHPNGCFTCDEYKKGYEEGRRNGFTAGYNKAMKEVEQKEQKPWKVGANAYFTPEQKPVEWSEEDKRKLNRIYEILGYAADDKGFLTSKRIIGDKEAIELQDFLKSLRPQLKQEWSEEDEEMRNLIVAIFEINHPNGFFKANELGTTDMRGVTTVEIIAWLKSLRPSWKPSEEQMKALYCALCEEISRTHFDALESLYKDLKKLM